MPPSGAPLYGCAPRVGDVASRPGRGWGYPSVDSGTPGGPSPDPPHMPPKVGAETLSQEPPKLLWGQFRKTHFVWGSLKMLSRACDQPEASHAGARARNTGARTPHRRCPNPARPRPRTLQRDSPTSRPGFIRTLQRAPDTRYPTAGAPYRAPSGTLSPVPSSGVGL